MPALPPVPNTLKVAFKHSDSSDLDVLTRLYFQYAGTAPTNSQLNTFAASCSTEWSTYLKGLFCTTVQLVGVTVEDLTSSTAAVGSWSGSIAGTTATPCLPGGGAVLVNYTIARRYRGGKPRSYWCAGAGGNVNTAQSWTSSFQTSWNSDYASFLTAIIALTWSGATISDQVNVSYYEGFASYQNPVTGRWKNLNKPRATPVVDVVTGWTLNVKPASQRRRNLH